MPWDLHHLQPLILPPCNFFFLGGGGMFGWLFSNVFDSFCCSISSWRLPYLTSCSYSELLNISVRSPGNAGLEGLKQERDWSIVEKVKFCQWLWLPPFCYSVSTSTTLSMQSHFLLHGCPWLFSFLSPISWYLSLISVSDTYPLALLLTLPVFPCPLFFSSHASFSFLWCLCLFSSWPSRHLFQCSRTCPSSISHCTPYRWFRVHWLEVAFGADFKQKKTDWMVMLCKIEMCG